MKIAQVIDYIPPAKNNHGSERLVENLIKGLVNLGHEVYLCCNPETQFNEYLGAKVVTGIPSCVDIVHHHGWEKIEYDKHGHKWISTIHGANFHKDPESAIGLQNVIAVSKFAAEKLKVPSYVLNCIDPDDFIYKQKKENYFLYMCSLDWFESKGLLTTIETFKNRKEKLIIAGFTCNHEILNFLKNNCKNNVEYIGGVNGKEKSELISNAKAYILPTRVDDACPLTVLESLVSGTPVICSSNGSLPELVNDKVGVVCTDIPLNTNGHSVKSPQLAQALLKINKIKPKDCYDYAMKNFHYIEAAKKYVSIYESVLKLK